MTIWLLLVDLVRALLFAAAHVCGNSLGAGILVVSMAVRIALLPLTLRIARRMMEHQQRLAALAPEIKALKKRFANDPRRLATATAELYARHDISPLPSGTLTPMLVQMPIVSALYRAITTSSASRASFLWIPNLGRPDVIVAAAGAALAAGATAATPGSPGRAALVVSAAISFVLAWRLSAGVGLYVLASNGVGVAQSLILRRDAPRKVS